MSLLEHERPDAGIAVLRLNRPDVRNAMDRALLTELEAALASLASEPGLRALVVSTTNVRALCAGADVGETLTASEGVERMEAFARFYSAIEAFPAVTIAVAVGNCVGAGAELVAGCDLRIAGDNLKLAWAGARLGVPVGPARLAPLVGLAIAKELVFTGRVVGAEEAAALHLASRVVAAEEAEAAALELARTVAANNGPGIRGLKRKFHAYASLAAHVADENAALVAFQRDGGGLPQGGGRN